ncbi:MAG: imidazole glycerol phosphate synthase subunit HisH [Promethearchaeota archaeon]
MITIINYGSGNLRSIQKSVQRFYPRVTISRNLSSIENSKGLILPGVGSFGDAVRELKQYGLFNKLKDIIETIPTLGICLGMQILFSNSEESIDVKGLDIISGKVLRQKIVNSIRVPHTGWNRLIATAEPIFNGYVYFNHSYYCSPNDKNLVVSYVNHGITMPAIILKDDMLGTQFHPEKSKEVGDEVIKYFISLIKR